MLQWSFDFRKPPFLTPSSSQGYSSGIHQHSKPPGPHPGASTDPIHSVPTFTIAFGPNTTTFQKNLKHSNVPKKTTHFKTNKSTNMQNIPTNPTFCLNRCWKFTKTFYNSIFPKHAGIGMNYFECVRSFLNLGRTPQAYPESIPWKNIPILSYPILAKEIRGFLGFIQDFIEKYERTFVEPGHNHCLYIYMHNKVARLAKTRNKE